MKTRRRISAWLLLSVFLPMLVFSSLHVHEVVPSATGACVDCANHLPHAGHLSLNSDTAHDCVLCQFTSLSFVQAAGLTFVAVAVLAAATVLSRPSFVTARAGRRQSPRAPPFV